jgi:hypothetical protein
VVNAREWLLTPLPDLPGYVHGIVSVDPPKVQCDGCGLVVTGDWANKALSLNLTIVTAGIDFDSRDPDSGRQCQDCRGAK